MVYVKRVPSAKPGQPSRILRKRSEPSMDPAGKTRLPQAIPATGGSIAVALTKLQRLVAAVNRPGAENTEFDQALDVLKALSQREGFPIAIVGGMAAIKHGY